MIYYIYYIISVTMIYYIYYIISVTRYSGLKKLPESCQHFHWSSVHSPHCRVDQGIPLGGSGAS